MLIIGCDFHSRFQQIVRLDDATGEVEKRRLEHGNGEAQTFHASLPEPALVGIESTGYTVWFAELMSELGYELVVGDAAKIRASETRKQKYDGRDAWHLMELLAEGKFPRIWLPRAEERDVRVLLHHRHFLVEMRTRVKNGLQALGLNRNLCQGRKLWTAAGQQAFQALKLSEAPARRRQDLLQLLAQLNGWIQELEQRLEQEAAQSARRYDPELKQDYKRLAFRHGWAKARVAVARKLAIRLYIMLRDQIDYTEFVRRGSYAGRPGVALV